MTDVEELNQALSNLQDMVNDISEKLSNMMQKIVDAIEYAIERIKECFDFRTTTKYRIVKILSKKFKINQYKMWIDVSLFCRKIRRFI